MYQEMGLSRDTAEAVAREVHQDPELAVKVHIVQSSASTPTTRPPPGRGDLVVLLLSRSAASSRCSRSCSGPLADPRAAVGAVVWFVVGALTSRFTTRPWWLAGLRQLMFGIIAAGATYLVGWLIGVNVGG